MSLRLSSVLLLSLLDCEFFVVEIPPPLLCLSVGLALPSWWICLA
jgi:hypothetical protein